MNSPGQKFVDDFDSEELKPMHPQFLTGSRILHAHSTLQLGRHGIPQFWADDQFSNTSEKNEFYGRFGEIFLPRDVALQNELKDSFSEEVMHWRKMAA